MPALLRWTERVLAYPRVYLGALAATIATHLILLFVAPRWNAGIVLVLAAAPSLFLVVWAVLSPTGLLRRDLGGHSAARFGGVKLVLAHLGATALQLALFAAVWLLGARWVFLQGVGVPTLLDLLPIPIIDWFVWIVVRVVIVAWVGLTLLAAIAQCSYLVGLLTDGRRLFLWLWSGLMLAWATIRFLPQLADWLAWLPYFRFQEFVAVGDGFEIQTIYYESGPYAAALLLVGIIVFASVYLYQVVTSPVPQAGPEAAGGKGEGGAKPRRVLNPKERVLIVIAALSLVFVYDVASNSGDAREGLRRSIVRPVIAYQDDLGFTRGAPFVASQGTIQHPALGIKTLKIKALGDVHLTASDGDTIVIDYTVRTFGDSARSAQAYHELIEVIAQPNGETLEVGLLTPPSQRGIGARVRFNITLPPTIRAEIEGGDGLIEAHGLSQGLAARLSRSSLRATDVRGRVDVEITDGDAWLTSIQGDVMLKHENGRVEVHGLEGSLTIAAQHSTFETSDVAGDVEAQLVRSLGRFHRLMGDLSIESLMARLEASHVTGALWIQGVLSPITLLQPLTAVTLSSERGNVIVQLDDKDWRLEVTAQRGSIQTSLPQEYEISHERRINSQSLSAVKGRGEALVRAEVRGANLWVGTALP